MRSPTGALGAVLGIWMRPLGWGAGAGWHATVTRRGHAGGSGHHTVRVAPPEACIALDDDRRRPHRDCVGVGELETNQDARCPINRKRGHPTEHDPTPRSRLARRSLSEPLMTNTTLTRYPSCCRPRRVTATLGIAVMAALACTVGVAPPREAGADTPPLPPHMYVAAHSGKALDVPEGSHTPGARLVQWRAHGGDNQLFRILPFIPET